MLSNILRPSRRDKTGKHIFHLAWTSIFLTFTAINLFQFPRGLWDRKVVSWRSCPPWPSCISRSKWPWNWHLIADWTAPKGSRVKEMRWVRFGGANCCMINLHSFAFSFRALTVCFICCHERTNLEFNLYYSSIPFNCCSTVKLRTVVLLFVFWRLKSCHMLNLLLEKYAVCEMCHIWIYAEKNNTKSIIHHHKTNVIRITFE